MPVIYAKHFPSFVWEADEHKQREFPWEGARVLLFDPVSERFVDPSVAQRLRELDPLYRDVDLVVFRGRGDAFIDSLRRDEKLIRAITSAPTFFGLVGGTKERDVQLVHICGPDPKMDFTSVVPCFRQVEIEGIVRRTEALFRDSRFHYLHPSGAHADGFLRLADALHDPIEVLRLTDW